MTDYIYLPVCATEDSTDCYWDATVQGNGTGTSFATYQGHTLTFTVPEGSYTLDVAVNPASPTGFTTVFQEYPAAVEATPAYDPHYARGHCGRSARRMWGCSCGRILPPRTVIRG